MRDSYGRTIEYMRISITDRCNLRCKYCMPHGISQVSMNEILTYEEIELICRAAVETGINRFKITGGEPLVRLGCAQLIGKIKRIPGVEQVTLTTNGVLLAQYLSELMENGLDAVNISLDTLEGDIYREITGYDALDKVREGIELAVKKGLPVKINSVLQKGVNEKEWKKLAELARAEKIDVRFIEMMPIGYGKERKVVSGEELRKMFEEAYPGIEKDSSVHGNGPAIYYKIPGFSGSIGFISAIHGKFCESCNRIRLTSTGELKPCLCYGDSMDLKDIVREKTSIWGNSLSEKDKAEKETVERVKQAIETTIRNKPREHCFETLREITEDRQMVQIGG